MTGGPARRAGGRRGRRRRTAAAALIATTCGSTILLLCTCAVPYLERRHIRVLALHVPHPLTATAIGLVVTYLAVQIVLLIAAMTTIRRPQFHQRLVNLLRRRTVPMGCATGTRHADHPAGQDAGRQPAQAGQRGRHRTQTGQPQPATANQLNAPARPHPRSR